jgi:tRNA A37 threonylcarbamoyladenosine modification protein TsaB
VTLTYAGKLAVKQLRAILMQGANNSKPMELVGLQLTRPQVFWGCYKEPNKTGAGQSGIQESAVMKGC